MHGTHGEVRGQPAAAGSFPPSGGAQQFHLGSMFQRQMTLPVELLAITDFLNNPYFLKSLFLTIECTDFLKCSSNSVEKEGRERDREKERKGYSSQVYNK